MTENEIQCLKDNIGRLVDVETTDGEFLVARVISVFYDQEYDEHELFYEVVSTNVSYEHLEDAGGYALDFDEIRSVAPHAELDAKS